MADPNGHSRLPTGAPGRLNLGSVSAGDAMPKSLAGDDDAMPKSPAGDGDAMTKSSAGDAMTKSSAGYAMAKSSAGDAVVNSSALVRPYRIGAPGRLILGSASAADAASINSSAGDATTKSSAGDAMTSSSTGDAMTKSSAPARPFRDADFSPLAQAPPPRTPTPAPADAATGAMGFPSLAPMPATLAEAKTLPCADHVPVPANKSTRRSSSSILDTLPDELTEEILLRLPADDPKLLVRICLVCKHWLRVVSDPAFLRRYRCFHPPPMLGFLVNHFDGEQCRDIGRFVATTSTFRPRADILNYSSVLDCCHGNVLLDVKVSASQHALIAWDPLAETEYCIGDFPRSRDLAASVTCALDRCDHRHCHGAPFLVLIVRTMKQGKDEFNASALLYSSEFDSWSERIDCSEPNQGIVSNASTVVVANKVYLPTKDNSKILVFDLQQMTFTTIKSPLHKTDGRTCDILWTDDGNGWLGFRYTVMQDNGFVLRNWSRQVAAAPGPGGANDSWWTIGRSVRMNQLRSLTTHRFSTPRPIGHNLGHVLIEMSGRIFSLELKSGQLEQLFQTTGFSHWRAAFPYATFYIAPGLTDCCLPLTTSHPQAPDCPAPPSGSVSSSG